MYFSFSFNTAIYNEITVNYFYLFILFFMHKTFYTNQPSSTINAVGLKQLNKNDRCLIV